MKDRIIEEAIKVLRSHPEGLYCGQLMKCILENRPELGGESFGFHLRNWKKEDALSPLPLMESDGETGFFKLALPQPREIYTDEELADLLNIHPAMLVQWKETQKIPERFLTLDGRYIKSMIDPMIASYRKDAPLRTTEMLSEEERLQMAILHEEGVSEDEISRRFHCESSTVDEVLRLFKMPTSAHGDQTNEDFSDRPSHRQPCSRKRIRFTPEDRTRMAVMHKQGLPMNEIAVEFGCSQSTISRILRRKDDFPSEKQAIDSPPPPLDSTNRSNPVEFEELVRNYWSVETRAVDLLFLPQEVRSLILHTVRETLRYAYERLNRAEPEPDQDEIGTPTLLPFMEAVDQTSGPELTNTVIRQDPLPHRAGRPKGSGKYGCETKAIRVPTHLVSQVASYVRKQIETTNDSDEIVYRRTPK